MATILHLETSTKVCSVAISIDGEVKSCVESNDEQYSHGEKLTLYIIQALEEAVISKSELDAVSVTSGPGSYTGLRIGAATAKGLCFSLNIPLISVDSLTSLMEQARLKHHSANLCPVIDARRMEVYNAVYNADGESLKEISADVIEGDSYENYTPFIYFGDGASKLSEVWNQKGRTADLDILSSALGHVRVANSKFLKEQFEDVAYFEPFYLKNFIAGKKSSKL